MDDLLELIAEIFFEIISSGFKFGISKIKKKRGIKKFRIVDYVIMFTISICFYLYLFIDWDVVLLAVTSIVFAFISSLILGTISNLALVSQSSQEE